MLIYLPIMKNEIDFKTKFRLLNSQENTEEIVWSCSDSSDYETSNINERNNNITKKHIHKKRKRKPSKKVLKNLSNLDVTITDGTQEHLIENGNKSPIFISMNTFKIQKIKEENAFPTSNINKRQSTSPILGSKNKQIVKTRCKSPILVPKFMPKSPTVSKKLFYDDLKGNKRRCVSPILTSVPSDKKCGLPDNYEKGQNISVKNEPLDIEFSEEINQNETVYCVNQSMDCPTKSSELIAKVKSYFTSNLSSDSLSQLSISEYETPKDSSKTSDEIEITEISQKLSLPNKSERSPSTISNLESDVTEKNKKVKYKKDGLAYCLNDLLKKQNANVCLWQHERFLAANSNFVIPKGVFSMFRIRTVHNKFGSFLLNAINDKDEEFLILINHLYVRDKIGSNVIIKLYKPYKILEYNDVCKLIVNVCKFECLAFTT